MPVLAYTMARIVNYIMANKNAHSLEWEQAYIVWIRSGFEIPMDADNFPDPKVWKWHDGPQRGVKDYVDVGVCRKPLIRHFSPSTNTWYESKKAPYIPMNIHIEMPKPQRSERSHITEDIETNDSHEVKGAGFSSIETFFQ